MPILLNFVEQSGQKKWPIHRAFSAQVPEGEGCFNIAVVTLENLQLHNQGVRNLVPGRDAPRRDTLASRKNVYLVSWTRKLSDRIVITPVIGGFHKGFETFREAVLACGNVWERREQRENGPRLRLVQS